MAMQQQDFYASETFFFSLSSSPKIKDPALQLNAAAVLMWACVHLIKSTVPFAHTVHGGKHLTD